MINPLEITVSNEAYSQLITLLKHHSEDYSCVKLSYSNGCCKSSKVDIYLDDLIDKEEYNVDNIGGIPFIYDDLLTTNIKKVEIIYKNSSFMLKATPVNNVHKSCSDCPSGCGSSGKKNSCTGCNHN
ncbi:hypothetical protein [Clostridium sp. JNZ J1-5]